MPVPSRPLDFPGTLLKKTNFVSVYYQPGLGAMGKQVATEMSAVVDIYYSKMLAFFGNKVPAFPVNLRICARSYAHTGIGAYHYPADPDIYADVFLNKPVSTTKYDRLATSFFFCCELLEMFAERQGKWNSECDSCEGLSRATANSLVPGQLDMGGWKYETAPEWLNSNRVNYFNQLTTSYTGVTIGANITALYWLRTVKGFTWDKIIAAGSDNLEQVYKSLTGKSGLYQAMMVDVQKRCPAGTSVPVAGANDNIFDNNVVTSEAIVTGTEPPHILTLWGLDGTD